MISSSICNPVHFVDKNFSSYPSRLTTLHIDRNHGRFFIIPYAQKFNNGDVITLQFSSDIGDATTLKAYIGSRLIDTIAVNDTYSIVGTEDTRYYMNYFVTLGAAYQNECVTFKLTQDADELTSEPIYTTDLSTQLANGTIKRIDYTNFDRIDSDLDGRLIDWAGVPSDDQLMFIYVEGHDLEPKDSDNTEILEGAVSDQIISASLKPGIQFKVSAVPEYLFRKIEAITGLDFCAVNEVEYIKDTAVEVERFGNSTSFELTVSLNEKNALNINVDDLGYINTGTVEYIKTTARNDQVTDFDVEIPDGYLLHEIIVAYNGASSGNQAVITAGLTLGGTDYVSDRGGKVILRTRPTPFLIHDQPSLTAASTCYVSITGIGVILDFRFQFLLNE